MNEQMNNNVQKCTRPNGAYIVVNGQDWKWYYKPIFIDKWFSLCLTIPLGG